MDDDIAVNQVYKHLKFIKYQGQGLEKKKEVCNSNGNFITIYHNYYVHGLTIIITLGV